MTAARSEAAPAASPPGPGDLPFEKALEELEGIVQRLEQGNVPLDESVAIYERGEALKRHCESLLQRAEARIQRITLGADGQAAGTAPLDVA
ncbi:exodeoxyribonuclease VII small subunit [Methylobacterium oryzihabitans]|uniref:Exodeoxyribonuclease 7 small subunit n=1 Tax=Methylobacterium oryzihabitans TaxID=2499852 RepID=A0A3S2V566_9HYPH|nr:exodeoxyribonuclease VII small subunit [Methylobacterium oryzihabitans]RVU13844.1 exodeoxyribonuclease VII small subunit [Methylobacterium oryzihabitans]